MHTKQMQDTTPNWKTNIEITIQSPFTNKTEYIKFSVNHRFRSWTYSNSTHNSFKQYKLLYSEGVTNAGITVAVIIFAENAWIDTRKGRIEHVLYRSEQIILMDISR